MVHPLTVASLDLVVVRFFSSDNHIPLFPLLALHIPPCCALLSLSLSRSLLSFASFLPSPINILSLDPVTENNIVNSANVPRITFLLTHCYTPKVDDRD